jgi:glycerol-3-phosphate acyltransferase PlsY
MIVIVLIGCYLIGSIPEAWLITRWVTGKDLRQMGSGNLGVSNTALSVARWAGLLVLLFEASKGILAVILIRETGGNEIAVALGALAAVTGTRWSIWLGGAGGRGNTVGVSALFLIAWQIPLVILGVWILLRVATRKSFLATRISLLTWPLIFWLVTQVCWYALCGVALCLIYLNAQRPETDDHSLITERWPSLWSFLISPRRKRS